MSEGRFLNQKLGKRTTRKMALLKARIQESGFRTQAPKPGFATNRQKDSGFGIQDKSAKR